MCTVNVVKAGSRAVSTPKVGACQLNNDRVGSVTVKNLQKSIGISTLDGIF